MDRPLLAFVATTLLLLMAGCLSAVPRPGDVPQNGLRIQSFTASPSTLAPGRTTRLTLTLNNTNIAPARNVSAELSNTNPLTNINVVATTATEDTGDCSFPRIRGKQTVPGGARAECIWEATAPAEIDSRISVPVTAVVTHQTELELPSLNIRFKDPDRSTVSREKQTVTVANNELSLQMTAPKEFPTDGEFVELRFSLQVQGEGDLLRNEEGVASLSVTYDGSLADLITEDRCRTEEGVFLVSGRSATFTCSVQLDSTSLEHTVDHAFAVSTSYAYEQSKRLNIAITHR